MKLKPYMKNFPLISFENKRDGKSFFKQVSVHVVSNNR